MSNDQRNELFSGASQTLTPQHPASSTNTPKMYDFSPPPASQTLQESLALANEMSTTLNDQSSQLENARDLGDNQEYLLTKSDRILRGMGSWSGWAYNTFVKGEKKELRKTSVEGARRKVGKGGGTTTRGRKAYGNFEDQRGLVKEGLGAYDVPTNLGDTVGASKAVDALNAYAMNVRVLGEGGCERELRGKVLEGIWGGLERECKGVQGGERVLKEGKWWRKEARGGEEWEELMRGATRGEDCTNTHIRGVGRSTTGTNAGTVGGVASLSPPSSSSSALVQGMIQRQDEDLEFLSSGLMALKGASKNINETLGRQNELIDEIEGAVDVNNDKVRRVVRRAGRINNGRGKGKVFKGWVTIGVEVEGEGGGWYLRAFNERVGLEYGREGGKRERGGYKDNVVWGMYGRRGGYNAVGFRGALTDRWIGQGFWGGFDAGGDDFGSKQEFEVDDEGKMGRTGGGTRILSGNAGWGKGEFLRWVRDEKDEMGGKLGVGKGKDGQEGGVGKVGR